MQRTYTKTPGQESLIGYQIEKLVHNCRWIHQGICSIGFQVPRTARETQSDVAAATNILSLWDHQRKVLSKHTPQTYLCLCLCDVIGKRIYTLINACTTFVREIYNGTLKKSVFKYVPTNLITQFSVCQF
jgi:hypothetical protein